MVIGTSLIQDNVDCVTTMEGREGIREVAPSAIELTVISRLFAVEWRVVELSFVRIEDSVQGRQALKERCPDSENESTVADETAEFI